MQHLRGWISAGVPVVCDLAEHKHNPPSDRLAIVPGHEKQRLSPGGDMVKHRPEQFMALEWNAEARVCTRDESIQLSQIPDACDVRHYEARVFGKANAFPTVL
jgi:hypothetical protein